MAFQKFRVLLIVLVLLLAPVCTAVAAPASSPAVSTSWVSWLGDAVSGLLVSAGAWLDEVYTAVIAEDSTQGSEEEEDMGTSTAPPTQNIGGIIVPIG